MVTAAPSTSSYIKVQAVSGNPDIFEIETINNSEDIATINSKRDAAIAKANRTMSQRATDFGKSVSNYMPSMPDLSYQPFYSKKFVPTSKYEPDAENIRLADREGQQYLPAPEEPQVPKQLAERSINNDDDNQTFKAIGEEQLGGYNKKKRKTRKRNKQMKTKKRRVKHSIKSKLGKKHKHRKSKKA